MISLVPAKGLALGELSERKTENSLLHFAYSPTPALLPDGFRQHLHFGYSLEAVNYRPDSPESYTT